MTNEEINKKLHEGLFEKCWHQFAFSGNVAKCEKCDFNTEMSEHDFYMGEPSNPDYCGNIADAWKVVEELRRRWYKIDPDETFFFQFIDCCEHGWRVDVMHGHHDGDGEVLTVSDLSLPLAICRAAVKVLEGE